MSPTMQSEEAPVRVINIFVKSSTMEVLLGPLELGSNCTYRTHILIWSKLACCGTKCSK